MPFYADSDGVGVRIPLLGEHLPPLYASGFMGYAMVVLAAGDDTGNSSASWGPVPDSAPVAASDTDADILVDTQDESTLFNIEGSAAEPVWICSVMSVVITAFTASVTLDIGDADNNSGWLPETSLLCTSTDQGFLFTDSAAATTDGAFGIAHGKYMPTSSGQIRAYIAGADPAVGRLAVFASYARVHRAGGNG